MPTPPRSKTPLTVVTSEDCAFLHLRHVCFSSDGSSIIAEIPGHKSQKTMDRLARWDSTTGTFIASTDLATSEEYCCDLKGNVESGRFAKKTDSRILVWNSSTLELLQTLRMPSKTISSGLAWSSSGRLLAANSRVVTVWNPQTGQIVAELDGAFQPVGFLSEDPPVLVLAGDTGLLVWRIGTRRTERVAKMPKGKGYCWDHALSPDGATIISSSERGTLAKTLTSTWKTELARGMRSSCGFRFSFSPDSTRAAITGSSGVVQIWDVSSHKSLLKWSKANYHSANSPCFSPDGGRLAVLLDGQLHLLDFTGQLQPKPPPEPEIPRGEHNCVAMVGPDIQMDRSGSSGELLNPRPIKCAFCGMPDLDHVASPYVLGKGTERPTDLAPAADGNVLVKPNVQALLELVAPGQCRFISTVHHKTRLPTPWLLAVPVHQATTATPPSNRERCPACGEAWSFHHFTESNNPKDLHSPTSTAEILKAKNWGCHTAPFKGWGAPRPQIFDRELFFSVRLESLLRRIKIRGLTRDGCCKQSPSTSDLAWVNAQYARLKSIEQPAGNAVPPESTAVWFRKFLADRAKKTSRAVDFDAIERERGLRFPKSFQDFALTVGQMKFRNFNGEEGLDGTIIHPSRMDFEEFESSSGADASPVRAVSFAVLNSGDSLCFDFSRKAAEPEVLLYDHETDSFEPMASSFVECLRMLVGR